MDYPKINPSISTCFSLHDFFDFIESFMLMTSHIQKLNFLSGRWH